MVIPSITQYVTDRQLVSKLLKLHNTLSTAHKSKFQGYEKSIKNYVSREDIINEFEDIFVGVSHDCANDTCLLDGTEISYSEYDSHCSTQAPGSASSLKHTCMSIVTDLNGMKTKPNKAGQDRFRFWVTEDGIYPEGDLDSCTDGYDCTAYVVLNHKFFNWEKK